MTKSLPNNTWKLNWDVVQVKMWIFLRLSFLFIWPSAFRNMALSCWSHGNQIRSRFSVWTVKRSLRASDSPWVESISQCCPDLSTGVSCVCADTGHWPSSAAYLSFLYASGLGIRVSEYQYQSIGHRLITSWNQVCTCAIDQTQPRNSHLISSIWINWGSREAIIKIIFRNLQKIVWRASHFCLFFHFVCCSI